MRWEGARGSQPSIVPFWDKVNLEVLAEVASRVPVETYRSSIPLKHRSSNIILKTLFFEHYSSNLILQTRLPGAGRRWGRVSGGERLRLRPGQSGNPAQCGGRRCAGCWSAGRECSPD